MASRWLGAAQGTNLCHSKDKEDIVVLPACPLLGPASRAETRKTLGASASWSLMSKGGVQMMQEPDTLLVGWAAWMPRIVRVHTAVAHSASALNSIHRCIYAPVSAWLAPVSDRHHPGSDRIGKHQVWRVSRTAAVARRRPPAQSQPFSFSWRGFVSPYFPAQPGYLLLGRPNKVSRAQTKECQLALHSPPRAAPLRAACGACNGLRFLEGDERRRKC